MNPTDQFLQQGLLGAVSVILAGVVIYKDRNEKKLQQQVDDEKDKRLQDQREFTQQIISLKDTFMAQQNYVAQSVSAIADKITAEKERA